MATKSPYKNRKNPDADQEQIYFVLELTGGKRQRDIAQLFQIRPGMVFNHFNRMEYSTEIVPILHQIGSYWQDLENEDFEQFYDAIKILKRRLLHRKFHLFDWPVIILAYSFTPGGRICARKIF